MKKFRLAVAGAVSAACLLTVAAPANADPDAVAEAKERLEAIQQESSAIDQEIIEASHRSDEAAAKLDQLNTDLAEQELQVERMSADLGAIAMFQFQAGGFDLTTQLLTSDSSESFLSSLATIQNETDRSNAALQELQVGEARVAELQTQADRTNAELQADLKVKKDKAAEFEAKEVEAQAIYDRLNAEEQERLRQLELERQRQQDEADRVAREAAAAERAAAAGASQGGAEQGSSASASSTPSATSKPAEPSASGSASSRAQRAVDVALAQVGKRYVWGTSGPNTFDCSGLTSYAYRQAGVSIIASSRSQAKLGQHVAKSDLQPGDLVFYYSPISHVGIYIGNGKIVDAANPRSGVRVTSLNSMPYTTARRVA